MDIVESPIDIAPGDGPNSPFRAFRKSPIERLQETLQALHADEIISLSEHPYAKHATEERQYKWLIFHTIANYARFSVTTWAKAFYSFLSHPLSITDGISVLFFALASTTALFFLMLWCLFANAPPVLRAYKLWSNKYGGGLNILNAANPNMFKSLSSEQARIAREALNKNIKYSPDTASQRVFNLDIARILLQCSALMYERSSQAVRDALSDTCRRKELTSGAKRPRRESTDISFDFIAGQLISSLLGENTAHTVKDKLHKNEEENVIVAYAAAMGLKYTTVSELNSTGAAQCGLFYDPEGTAIILSFKGTSAGDFQEWTTDMSYATMDAGHWIRGFGKVHGGFLEKMFPSKIRAGSRYPYDTIREAVKATAETLLMGKPDGTEVNVWFTGHSLGCAMASLAYARAINEPLDFGRGVRIRDCYLFAAPILCDVPSVKAFNNRMTSDGHYPRTMWRCTNGRDFVAMGLPDLGDRSDLQLGPYNLFGFAHLGTEIRMKSKPLKSLLKGNHITAGAIVEIQSLASAVSGHSIDLTKDDNAVINERGNLLARTFSALSHVPLVSTMVDHCVFLYWDQLNRLAIGQAEWDEN